MKTKKEKKSILQTILPAWLRDKIKKQLFKILLTNYTYKQDGIISEMNCEFINYPKFKLAYSMGKKTGSWGGDIHWRAYVACWAAQLCKFKSGDFVECGVNRGGLAMTILIYTNLFETNKKFYLLDTFNGLIESQITEREKKLGIHAKGYSDCWYDVCNTFNSFSKTVRLVRGGIPDTLRLVDSNQIAFISIDMNCAAPEIAAAEYFWPRLVSGGIILLDDYGWPGRLVQKNSFDKFAKERNIEVLALPTGQGLIIKP